MLNPTLLALVLITAISSNVFAGVTHVAESAAPNPNANINTGNWNVGGSASFAKNSGKSSDSTEFSLGLDARYFLIDRFALGLGLGFDTETGQSTLATLGPSGTYFFWSDGKLASFAAVGFRFGLTDATIRSIMRGNLGLEYFIVPSVAFGPTLFFNHYNSKYKDYQRYGLALGLNIYL